MKQLWFHSLNQNRFYSLSLWPLGHFVLLNSHNSHKPFRLTAILERLVLSNRLLLLFLETFLHPRRGNADLAQCHEIAGVTEVVLTPLLPSFCPGELWRAVGFCEESCVCHRIRDLILGCIRKLTDMVGSRNLSWGEPLEGCQVITLFSNGKMGLAKTGLGKHSGYLDCQDRPEQRTGLKRDVMVNNYTYHRDIIGQEVRLYVTNDPEFLRWNNGTQAWEVIEREKVMA